jgi:hypothetical protein
MFVPLRKLAYRRLLPVTGIALLFHIWMLFASLREHAHSPSRPVTIILVALLFYMHMMFYITGNTPMGPHGLLRGKFYFLYVDDVRTSQERHL